MFVTSPPPPSYPLPGNGHIVPILVFCLMNTIMNKEIQKSPPPSPGNAAFSGNIQNNRPNKRSSTPRAYITLPLAHTPNQSVPGLFAKTFPLALPACPPVRLSNPPASVPGTFEDHSEYSDLPTRPPVPEEVRMGGLARVANWKGPPLPKVAVSYSPEGDKCAREKVTPGDQEAYSILIHPSHLSARISLPRPVPVHLPTHTPLPPNQPVPGSLPPCLGSALGARMCGCVCACAREGREMGGGLLGGSGGTGGPFFPHLRTRTTAPDLPPGPPARDRRGDSCSLHQPPSPAHSVSLVPADGRTT